MRDFFLVVTGMIRKTFEQIASLADPDVHVWDKVDAYFSALSKLAPIVFIASQFNWWISENEQFGIFICVAMFVNAIVGIVAHLKNRTFNFMTFIVRNLLMIFVICAVYVVLEMLRYTAGDNIAGELFRILIQSTTLMYPTSKVFKNAYILSDGKYPPEWLMRRLYDFEKNGDLRQFFKGGSDEVNSHADSDDNDS